MNKIRFLLYLVYVSIAISCDLCAARAEFLCEKTLDSVSVVSSICGKIDDGNILFKIKNLGKSRVTIVRDYLPWKTMAALRLNPKMLNGVKRKIDMVVQLDNPSASLVVLGSQEEISGVVNISKLFREWRAIIKDGVVIEWTLSLYDVKTGFSREYVGSCIFVSRS